MISKDAVMCYACGVSVEEAAAKAASGEAAAQTAPKEEKKPQIFVKKIVKKQAP
jgi:hypothetical protein